MTAKTSISYGGRAIELDIDRSRITFDLQPADVAAAEDPPGEVRRALSEPIATRPLRELVSAGQKVFVLGDDATRITPTEMIAPLVLDELATAGV